MSPGDGAGDTCTGCAVQITRGSALLGYVPVGNVGLVLLATRIRDVLTLPGGHVVKLVVESKWFTVPLQVRLSHTARNSRKPHMPASINECALRC